MSNDTAYEHRLLPGASVKQPSRPLMSREDFTGYMTQVYGLSEADAVTTWHEILGGTWKVRQRWR
jgi:hypothetical protein